MKFKYWESQGKPLGEFERKKRDIHGNEVVWVGGLLAKFGIEDAEAYNGLLEMFEQIGHIKLMRRCKRTQTQNINESTHSKLWKHCLKIKKHGKLWYIFCSKHVMMVHNFGHYAASFHHVLGTMSESTEKALKYNDLESQNMAERKHELKEGGKKNYRVKRKCNPQKNEDPFYQPGSEPIL